MGKEQFFTLCGSNINPTPALREYKLLWDFAPFPPEPLQANNIQVGGERGVVTNDKFFYSFFLNPV